MIRPAVHRCREFEHDQIAQAAIAERRRLAAPGLGAEPRDERIAPVPGDGPQFNVDVRARLGFFVADCRFGGDVSAREDPFAVENEARTDGTVSGAQNGDLKREGNLV